MKTVRDEFSENLLIQTYDDVHGATGLELVNLAYKLLIDERFGGSGFLYAQIMDHIKNQIRWNIIIARDQKRELI